MSRILVCSSESYGFLFPSIGIAKALEDRGHTVRLTTGASAEQLLINEGLVSLPWVCRTSQAFATRKWGKSAAIALQVKYIEAAAREFRPDIIVGQQFVIGALLAAQRLRVPIATLGMAIYLWPRSGEAGGWRQFLYDEYAKLVAGACQELGLRSCDPSKVFDAKLLVRGFPALEGESGGLPPQVQLVGPCLWEPEDDNADLERRLEEARSRGRPILYVQHGAFFHARHFWRDLLTAAERLEVEVYASISRMDSRVGDVPRNVIARRHISQRRIMKYASGVVSSGNTTVALGAAMAGVPSVIVPAGGEGPVIARRWNELGIAVILDSQSVTPRNMASAIHHILTDSQIRSRAEWIAAEGRDFAGWEHVCAAIEDLIASSDGDSYMAADLQGCLR